MFRVSIAGRRTPLSERLQAIYRCMVRIVWATIGRYTPTGSPDITDSRYSNLVVLEWLGKIADGRAR